jgi:hypothetical protein
MEIDPDTTGDTNIEGILGGGDVVTGSGFVSDAMAASAKRPAV